MIADATDKYGTAPALANVKL